MKTLITILLLPLFFSTGAENTPAELQDYSVAVYYFHHERRCATCLAVEKVAKEAVREFYGDSVPFMVVNLDVEKGKKTADKLGVEMQALIVVKGDQKIDITNEAFLNARSKPEKVREMLREKIDPLLD